MIRVNLQEIFDRVECNDTECRDCDLLKTTQEEWGVDYDCIGSKYHCHQVDAKKDELEAFMADHHAEFELLEQVS